MYVYMYIYYIIYNIYTYIHTYIYIYIYIYEFAKDYSIRLIQFKWFLNVELFSISIFFIQEGQ